MSVPIGYKEHYCEDILTYFRAGYKRAVDKKKSDHFPTFSFFAVEHCGVSPRTLDYWRTDYPEFGEAYEQAKAYQETKLLNNGLSGSYNPVMAKLVLGKHGYADEVKTTVKDDKNEPQTEEEINAAIKELEYKAMASHRKK